MKKPLPQHPVGRPNPNLVNVRRLTESGEWIPDDGQPGVAFSGTMPHRTYDGRLVQIPVWVANDCRCFWHKSQSVQDACPQAKAIAYTAKRFGAANGEYFKKPAA